MVEKPLMKIHMYSMYATHILLSVWHTCKLHLCAKQEQAVSFYSIYAAHMQLASVHLLHNYLMLICKILCQMCAPSYYVNYTIPHPYVLYTWTLPSLQFIYLYVNYLCGSNMLKNGSVQNA